MIDDRYNRQELIEGWNQEALGKTRVVIVGSGTLANYTALSLASLGIGNIEIYDNAKVMGADKEFLYFSAKEGEAKSQALEQILKKINPTVKIKGINMSLEKSPLISIIGKPDVIIDLTNSPNSKATVLNYAKAKGIKTVSCSASEEKAEIYIVNPEDDSKPATLEEYVGKTQGNTVSGIIGGIIAEEIRKIAMPFSQTDVPVKKLVYSLASGRRFSADKDYDLKNKKNSTLKDKKVLIVGAGALGNFVALGTALEGVGNIDVMDFDEVESTNLNRQVLFYDAVGKKKAVALCEKLAEIAPYAKLNPIVDKLHEKSDYFDKNKPDLIIDCVDSFAVRAVINYFAVKHKIPLVSGGTNPKSGQVIVYEPEKTACLDCKIGVEKALAEHRKAAPCRYAPDPSVIMTNQIVGEMMVGEAVKVLDKNHGEPVKKILKYDSTMPVRGGVVGSQEPCECKKQDVNEWLQEVDKKAAQKAAEQTK